ncbi:hypothetical protein C8J56DRAFT_889376 [Mycena floridula]|nr:hypothetical protein C8J56DRAFT_889376 [Mycena floridula]
MARKMTTNTTSDPPKKCRSANTTSSHLSRRSRKAVPCVNWKKDLSRGERVLHWLDKHPNQRHMPFSDSTEAAKEEGQVKKISSSSHGKQQYLKHLSSRLSKIYLFSSITTDSLGVGPDPGFGGRNFVMGGDNGMGAGPSQIEVVVNIVSRHIQSIVSATIISSLTFCATVWTLKEPSHNPEAKGAELESGRLAEQIITTVFIYKCLIIDQLLANF